MEKDKTPQWLLDTQNKSWEPEILISGITLTFIFLLSGRIFNFCGMLIQDYGLYQRIGKSLFSVLILILSGLKIVLIIHLILRGIWTGLIGLSYVFPDGIKREKLKGTDRNIEFRKPVEFVIRIERICSILFSFIFSIISFVLTFIVFYIPIILLFIIGLDPAFIRIFTLVLGIGIALVVLISLAFFKKLDNSEFKKRYIGSLANSVLMIYSTNFGVLRAWSIAAAFILISLFLSLSEISGFDFENDEQRPGTVSGEKAVKLNNEHYAKARDGDLRISRAMIDRFDVDDDRLELFIAIYKDDRYTLERIEGDSTLIRQYHEKLDGGIEGVQSLYRMTVDGDPVSGTKWYTVDDPYNGQRGLMTRVPIESLENGHHELRLDKFYWSVKKGKLMFIENWDVIPFELTIDR